MAALFTQGLASASLGVGRLRAGLPRRASEGTPWVSPQPAATEGAGVQRLGTHLTFQSALMALGTAATVSAPALGVSSQAAEQVPGVTEEQVRGRWGLARLAWGAQGWATGAGAREALDSAGPQVPAHRCCSSGARAP